MNKGKKYLSKRLKILLSFFTVCFSMVLITNELHAQNSGRWNRMNLGPTYQVYGEGSYVVFLDESTCYARSVHVNNVKRQGNTYYVYDEDGVGGQPWYDRDFYVDGCGGSGNSGNRSDLNKTLETANDVANIAKGVAAIAEIFSDKKSKKKEQLEHNRKKEAANLKRKTVQNYTEKYKHITKDDTMIFSNDTVLNNKETKRVDSSNGFWSGSNKGNVRNVEGRRANKAEENTSKEKNTRIFQRNANDDWKGGIAPKLEPHEKRAKKFFGGVKISASSRELYEVGVLARTATYDLLSLIPYVGDAKEVYVKHISEHKETDTEDYWRKKILGEDSKIYKSLKELDQKTYDYRETSTVKVSF